MTGEFIFISLRLSLGMKRDINYLLELMGYFGS